MMLSAGHEQLLAEMGRQRADALETIARIISAVGAPPRSQKVTGGEAR